MSGTRHPAPHRPAENLIHRHACAQYPLITTMGPIGVGLTSHGRTGPGRRWHQCRRGTFRLSPSWPPPGVVGRAQRGSGRVEERLNLIGLTCAVSLVTGEAGSV